MWVDDIAMLELSTRPQDQMETYKSVVFLAGAALVSYAGLGDTSSERGQLIMGKHMNDTRTARREIRTSAQSTAALRYF